MKRLVSVVLVSITLFSITISADTLPENFVYLKDIDPSILQDMRYATFHNFVGRPISGYAAGQCILTKPAALALKKIQRGLKKQGYCLKVYDCYRPTCAVEDFMKWSFTNDAKMQEEFYPREKKQYLFRRGYISSKSCHCRGSTVDITIVNLNDLRQTPYSSQQKLVACYAPRYQRFPDNSIDMGTGFDCFDRTAWPRSLEVSPSAHANRMWLRKVMVEQGFIPLKKEWWHFTLKNEPFKHRSFNFKVE